MAVMQTLGFARYFRDPVVAVVGGAAMLPIATAAAVGAARRSR
jgi:putative membrane protein